MALLQIEGFDGISTVADLTAKGYSVAGTPVIGSTSPTPRTGAGRIKCSGFAYSTNLTIPFTATQTVYIGLGMYIVGTPDPSNGPDYMPIILGNGDGEQLFFEVIPSGFINVRSGSPYYSPVIIGTSDSVVPFNTWFYLEIYAKASNTVGEVTLKLNGVTTILTLTNQDTLAQGSTATYNSVRLGSVFSQIPISYDDIYIDNSTFHGDCKVELLLPNGAGNYTQFTPSTGSNYTCVDEAVPNDADYVEDSVVGDKDSYNFEALSSDNIIEGVQLNIRAEKTDAGSKEIRGFTRINSTDYNGNTLALSNTSYLYNKKIWEVNPNTSTAWTKAVIDGAEFGVEITV